MINLFKRLLTPPEPPKRPAKVFLIDPVQQSISEIASPYLPSLVSELVGDSAECYKLDNNDNVVWLSDTDTNERYGFYFEGMPDPFSVLRFSKGLVVSLPSLQVNAAGWDRETILDWIIWYDKQDPWNNE
jgi:hypothetical protein